MLQRKVALAPRSQKLPWPYKMDSVFQVFDVWANANDISCVKFRGEVVKLGEAPRYVPSEPYRKHKAKNFARKNNKRAKSPQHVTPESSEAHEVSNDWFMHWYKE